MKCPSCGAEIAYDSIFCEFCGKPVKLQRNGFVTFWLWLILIANVISAIRCAFVYYDQSAWMPSDIQTILLVSGGASLFVAIGAIVLLNWKKAGFWMIVLASLLSDGLLLWLESNYRIAFDSELMIISSIVGLLILFLVLRIKKNGLSCWSQLK